MTIIELFPWLIAFCITLFSTCILRQFGVSDWLALSVGLASGIAFLLLFMVGGKHLVSMLERRKNEREKSEKMRRIYKSFDTENHPPTGKNLFYECLVCENVIPSLQKGKTTCACKNILIESNSNRVVIRNKSKVKLFSVSKDEPTRQP